ncbi:MAG: hypothetical protein ACTSUP_07315 [Candidatus Heimdallarchaeaceae archaeon]
MDIGMIILMIIIGVLIIVLKFASSARKKRNKARSIQNKSSKITSRIIPKRINNPPRNNRRTKDLEWIKNEIMENEENVLRLSMGYRFNIPKGHRYDLFSAIKVTRENRKTFKVVATLTKIIPSYLDIRPTNSYYGATKDTFSVIDLNRNFKFYSTAPDMWREIFTNSHIKDLLQYNASFIQHYYLRGEYMEAIVSYDRAIITVLTITQLMHEGLKQLFGVLDSYEIEKLICYNCKDPFDPLEEECDKCGSSRPRCIVCLLDLYPSDLERDVVTTPCCGVYGHKDHIITWLKQDPRCPNCHKNLNHWLGQLQIY